MFPLPREKWLDVVRRLERANDEIRCILTDNNVRTRSTKMKFNKLNVRFNSAWVSARTPPSCRLIGDRYANERRPLIRAMFYSVSDHLLVLRLRFFFSPFTQNRLFALCYYEIYAHFWFSSISHAIFIYFLSSFILCSILIDSIVSPTPFTSTLIAQCVCVRPEPWTYSGRLWEIRLFSLLHVSNDDSRISIYSCT